MVGELIAKAERKGTKMHLPFDFITGDKFDKDAAVSQSPAGLASGELTYACARVVSFPGHPRCCFLE